MTRNKCTWHTHNNEIVEIVNEHGSGKVKMFCALHHVELGSKMEINVQ